MWRRQTVQSPNAGHLLFRSWDPDAGECSGIAFGIAVEPHDQCAGIALVSLNALAARVEPLGRDDDIRDAHFLQGAMKVVAEGPSLVAGVELDARAAGILDEFESLIPLHLERGLRGSVAELATHGDLGGVEIQTEIFLMISLAGALDFWFARFCFTWSRQYGVVHAACLLHVISHLRLALPSANPWRVDLRLDPSLKRSRQHDAPLPPVRAKRGARSSRP